MKTTEETVNEDAIKLVQSKPTDWQPHQRPANQLALLLVVHSYRGESAFDSFDTRNR